MSDDELALAELAGNLASRGGFDAVAAFERFQIGFVLVTPAAGTEPDAVAVRNRTVASLDARPELAAASESGYGTLWAVSALERVGETAHSRGVYGSGVLAVQGIVVAVASLLAIPTRRRRRVVQTRSSLDEPAATTFDEDSDG